MLNALISQKVSAWFEQEDCPARQIIAHIQSVGFLRDAQIEAIKTYLFLKIAWGNRPLARLFGEGLLAPHEDLASLPLSVGTRQYLEQNADARALFEFSRTKTGIGSKTLLPELERFLLSHAAEVDCGRIISRLFYDVEYPDYLFSLPMGAGKTFLMAAMIYLDLYFAQNEPENPTFAHNFILLVPSGLKSSIIPSLKTIENFDPAWVLPEPAASSVRKLIKFEILDQAKTASKSNKARNPNAQKISQYQPFEDMMGLVIVTNAEKVVLDQVKLDTTGRLFPQTDDEKDKAANELRNLIGKIPHLQILIDEVHHAATDDIKLRQVVNNWHAGGNITGVLGFSGTPYLSPAEEVRVADGISVKFSQITSTVFYYPLTRAIEGFLKKPAVKTLTGLDSRQIVRQGVTDFLNHYGDKEYQNGATAKLAVYCGSIERLETDVYPLLIGEMGIAPDDILKYHRGNADYKLAPSAEAEWRALDTPLSRKRIVLLVQIGKEGWDCRSLTGVILSQKGDSPTNMVLQTSCRCLRQMDGGTETAGIWLNADNAKVLDKQLAEEQQTSIDEINRLGKGEAAPTRPRFSRVEHLHLPPVEFYQLQVHYQTLTTQEADPAAALGAVSPEAVRRHAQTLTRGLSPHSSATLQFGDTVRGEPAVFSAWLLRVAKGSFGAVTLADLRAFEPTLYAVFETITYEAEGVRWFNALYDEASLAAQIRLAFYTQRTLHSHSEMVSVHARLLLVEKLTTLAVDTKNLYPSVTDAASIQAADATGQSGYQYAVAQRAALEAVRETMKAQGLDPNLFTLPDIAPSTAVNNKDRSLHCLPYRFDSSFEMNFLEHALTLESLRARGLELYFNGAGELTEFRIDCFARNPHGWSKVGKYTPDFLLVERRDGAIYRALIVETKGSGYAEQSAFVKRRAFVETEFLKRNAEKFGYDRFDYLYLSDADPLADNLHRLCQAADTFFTT